MPAANQPAGADNPAIPSKGGRIILTAAQPERYVVILFTGRNGKDLNRFYRYVYLYVRYACILYIVLFLVGVSVFLLELFEPSELFMNIFFISGMSCIPAFMILPGLIYDDYKGAFHGFTFSQLSIGFQK